MSMQICVLTDSQFRSIAEWQKAIDAEGCPLRLSGPEPGRNLVARLRETETSIEYGIYDFGELKSTYEHVNFGHDWKFVIAFTWSSDFIEEIAAWMAATAYAHATEGVVFDEQEGKLFTPEESLQVTRDIERREPEMKVALQSFVEGLSAKSPQAQSALRDFLEKRSPKLN
jgi:hypothetical protein